MISLKVNRYLKAKKELSRLRLFFFREEVPLAVSTSREALFEISLWSCVAELSLVSYAGSKVVIQTSGLCKFFLHSSVRLVPRNLTTLFRPNSRQSSFLYLIKT